MKDEYFSSFKDADRLTVIILLSQMVRSSYRPREEHSQNKDTARYFTSAHESI